MTYSKVFAFVAIALCTTSALAAGGHGRSFRGNDFNPRQDGQNADMGYEQRQQRQQQEAEPARQRNEGFGYGFERRQEHSDRPDFGRRNRN